MDKIKYVAFYGEVYLLNYIKIKTTCLKLYILYIKHQKCFMYYSGDK